MSENDNIESTPPKKKMKRISIYKTSWETSRSWLKSKNGDAYCKICNKSFTVAYKGFSAVTLHEISDNHKKKIQSNFLSTSVSKFFVQKNSLEERLVTSFEVANIYHCCKHNLSYNSLDCGLKLISKGISDSKIAPKISCGRTKSEAILINVLAPKMLEDVIGVLKNKSVFFSIQLDASNHKNRKMFPLCVQYFTLKDGIQNKIIDFYEDSNETATGMFQAIMSSIQNLGLSINQVSAFSTDNTNANFGKNHSVFTNLKTVNKNIFKANCHAHILHNCLKQAVEKLDIDIEGVILKFYSHFSVSAKRRDELKEFHNFVDIEFSELLRHVVTRWLSLLPCINRILKSWPALKSYFESLGENTPKALQKILIMDENFQISNRLEIYLFFCSHVLPIFEETIKKLEANELTCLDIFKHLKDFKFKIDTRKSERFFGFEVRNMIKDEKIKIDNNFLLFYENILNYTEKHFDFADDNILAKLGNLSLEPVIEKFPSFNIFVNLVEELHLQSTVNQNKLFDEIMLIKQTIFKTDIWHGYKTSQKWSFIFQNITGLENVFVLISFALSIPATSAFPERIFSLMNIKWRDERNRALLDLIKSELIVFVNSESSCLEFFDIVKSDEKLLDAAKNQKKYKFK